ncbi:phosphatase and actin regulator 3 isoform X2 [Ambystoma mexicanum]|uniref:phosphatase and actin regulator 3 isoform X2 n=1 Tax=Ambystoma mexicanum TaxID=8296 RepID=UPI0037E977BC
MAAAEDGIAGYFIQRSRPQSDPSILQLDAASESGDSPDEMDHTPALRLEYLGSGIRTPPVRRNSKLATLGRIFKPWKWRKKKSEKLKQTSAVLEKKMTTRQSRDELIKKGLLEMMEHARKHSTASDDSENDAPSPAMGRIPQALYLCETTDSPQRVTERVRAQSPIPQALSMAQPKLVSWMPALSEEDEMTMKSPPSTLLKNSIVLGSSHVSGHINIFQPSTQKGSDPVGQSMRGQYPTPTGSPHLAAIHLPLPPSRVIEELHRALASKHRQDSFHGRENKASPKRRVEFRTSRTSSIEHNNANLLSYEVDVDNKWSSAKESDENKENLIRDSGLIDSSLLYQDEELLNDSIISGTLPRKCKKELLAVKLRNRPSKQELEDRNIFPRRTDQERQEIRQQIEMKLSKRLSQRPAVEELERRNILKQRNDQTEQEERREIKQRLTRKLNQRPTVDELRDRKILIRFSDYVEVAKAQDYDRRADKPWTRLSAADKAAIRKELNEYKSNEMEVHASSKHLTRYHRP